MSKEAKVGLFVTITIICGVAWYIWAARVQFERRNKRIELIFPDVAGLRVGDPVMILGIRIGKVHKLIPMQESVKVVAYIKKDINIYTDASARIKDLAVLGGAKYIALKPGKSGIPLPEGKRIRGEPDILPVSTYAEVGDRINKILDRITTQEMVKTTTKTMENIGEAAKELTLLLKDLRKSVENTLKETNTSLKEIREVANKMKRIAERADTIMLALKNNKSTIGNLIYDDKIYNDLKEAINSVKELAKDIKEHPGRYIKVRF